MPGPPGPAGADGAGSSLSEFTTTSTGNLDDFDFDDASRIRANGSSAAVFRGLLAGTAGQTVVITNINTSTVKVAHQDTNSAEANRIICPSTNGQIIGANGSITLVYDGTTERWRVTAVEPGAAISVAYNSGDYTGNSSITWTVASGDVTTFQYQQRGTLLYVWIEVKTSTVSGSGSSLLVAIPGGFTCSVVGDVPAYIADNNNFQIGITGVHSADQTKIRFVLASGANWAAATDTTWVKAYPVIIQVS
jgi:hypothetical protein